MPYDQQRSLGRAYPSHLLDVLYSMPQDAKMPKESLCPICGKSAVQANKPFCGRRCADIDLSRWLNGVYAVPVREAEDEDGIPSVAPDLEPP